MRSPSALLLVEDDPDEVEVAVRALGRAGLDFAVEIARDGVQALEALGLEGDPSAAPFLPRVVFLDLKLPRIDGWEVLRRIREHPRTARLPVVVLSSSDRPEDIQRSYALGANSFLRKRFDARGPGAYFAEAVHYWVQLNRSPGSGGEVW